MTDQPSTQEGAKCRSERRHGGCTDASCPVHGIMAALREKEPITQEACPSCRRPAYNPRGPYGGERCADPFHQPTTQEAEKALEASIENMNALLVGCEGKAMSSEALYPVLNALFTETRSARAALRSLRTQHTELRDEMQEWINATARARQDREAFREALDEQAERINALQLQHTKDQERIEQARAEAEAATLLEAQRREEIERLKDVAQGNWELAQREHDEAASARLQATKDQERIEELERVLANLGVRLNAGGSGDPAGGEVE